MDVSRRSNSDHRGSEMPHNTVLLLGQNDALSLVLFNWGAASPYALGNRCSLSLTVEAVIETVVPWGPLDLWTVAFS
jgi:hypothetical protein